MLNPLQNLDGFMAVMNATNDSSIYRLKKTWGRLSPQARDLWHDLKLYTEKGARYWLHSIDSTSFSISVTEWDGADM